MPKKHAPSYAHTKPSSSYIHPSLQSSRSQTSSPGAPQTVNERINQLRREQAPRATSQRRDEIIEVVTTRTVPPALRRILQMVEVDAPPPKPGSRSQAPRTRRPPPGPAAPSSWLQRSRYAPDRIRNLKRNRVERDGEGLARFTLLARLHNAEMNRLPPDPSLRHFCLKKFAIHWEELVEFEQYYVPALPIPLKEALLSYLAIYGVKDCMTFKSFKILFQNDIEVDDATGSEDIRFLDLTGLLNQDFTLSDLNRCLTKSSHNAGITLGLGDLSLDAPKSKEKAAVAEVVESWEDEADQLASAPLPATLHIPLFPNLTRLSLAHPRSGASWPALLTVSTKLHTLTHLSLAYWPTPSATPNAATASMVSKHSQPVALGGSHFYSELDDDWHEAANILRRLSLNTYCLQWLDLEGCTWHKALTWDFAENPQRRGNVGGDDWVRPSSSPGPDWAGSWRQIEYLNLYQGWIPGDKHSLRTMPAGVIAVELLGWLREHEDDEGVKEKLGHETGHAVADWVEKEKAARSVAFNIQQARRLGNAKYCKVYLGWEAVRVRPLGGGAGSGSEEG